jgi:glycosyltransferase involved in cell wall biosynthesis
MRVLAVTNLYPNPFDRNRGVFNRQQLCALAAEHDVRIISPIAWTDELSARWHGHDPLPASRQVVCDGITIDYPRYLYPPRVLRGCYGHCFRYSIRTAFERALAEFHPDVVLGAWAYPDGWAAVELGHRAGLPVVIKVLGCDILCGGRGLDRYPTRKAGTIAALRQADGIMAVSKDLARHVVDLGVDPERVRVIYDGINAQLFHPGSRSQARAELGLSESDPLILFVGSLVAVKGIDVLIDACAQLAKQGLRFRCLLVGQGQLRAALEKQIAGLGLQGHVELLGSRPHDQLPAWYRAADVFVLPSRSEGVPNVLQEAIACGTPFVASRVGGIPEIAHLGPGQLVPPGDPAALSMALLQELRNPGSGPAKIRSHQQAAADLAELFAQLIPDSNQRLAAVASS